MRVLLWHVHGSYTTALVQGPHRYLLPTLPGRGPWGRGRARTWDWPPAAVEVGPAEGKAARAARAARAAALARYGLDRFLAEWDVLLEEVCT